MICSENILSNSKRTFIVWLRTRKIPLLFQQEADRTKIIGYIRMVRVQCFFVYFESALKEWQRGPISC